MPFTRTFTFERETKNTYRFREDPVNPDEADQLIDVLYVKKAAFDARPQKLRVSVEDITT
jgi:hypothetical protein